MKVLSLSRICFIIVIISALTVSGTIINVPDDQTTIQAGIDASSNGDTVLVQPGTYIENINFNGHNIVLGSLYLTTANESYIGTTIIDGDSSGSVVIAVGLDSTAMLCGFTITNGAGENGGGINMSGGLKVTKNIISHNYVFDDGGGIRLWGGTLSKIIDNVISYNIAEGSAGGIYVYESYSVIIQGNKVSHNEAFEVGGVNIGFGSDHEITVIGNIIDNNQALRGIRGGGIRLHYCSGEIAYNIISNNSSVGIAGGVYLHRRSYPNFHHNLIFGNVVTPHEAGGSFGGGIYIHECQPSMFNNTIINNQAANGAGGGIYSSFAYDLFYLRNNIIRGNSADSFPQIYQLYGSMIINYCDIEGGWSGDGNIDCDPWFCLPTYYLADSSCCVGAGCDSLGVPNDTIDIGAFGVGCSTGPDCDYIPGDINGDGDVIGSDVTFGVNYFRGSGSYPPDIC